MFKFLIILGIIAYLIYKIGGLFFRAGAASQNYQRKPFHGSADATNKKDRKRSNFKGGDYIDYEEIK